MALLEERTVLACLHCGVWSNNARDQEVNDGVSERYESDTTASKVTKQLIHRKHLKNVNSKLNAVKHTHKVLTLPWEDGGIRILSTNNYFGYAEQMRLGKLGFEAAVSEFCTNMPTYIEDAKRNLLGKMFDPDLYPSVEELKATFWLDVEIKPTPKATDFRAELSDATVKAIIKDIERRTDERLKNAMNDVFQRVADVTSKMVERLRAYKPVEGARAENGFRDSLVYNIKELAELLPALNITGDNRLNDLESKLIDLASNSPELLRDGEKLRQQTADKAERILKKVQGYLA